MINYIVAEPTHYRGNILDLILISEPNLIQNINVNSPIPGCDHNPILSVWVVGTCDSQNHDKPTCFKRKFLNANYDALNFELLGMDWCNIFLGIFDVNELWTVYMNIITDLVNKYVPICSFNSHKRSAWSAQVRKLHNRQRYLHKKYKQTLDPNIYCEYLEAARIARSSKRSARADVEKGVLESDNIRSFFSYVRSKLTCKSAVPSLVDKDGKLLLSDMEKAEEISKYFSSVFTMDDGNSNTNYQLAIKPHRMFILFLIFRLQIPMLT